MPRVDYEFSITSMSASTFLSLGINCFSTALLFKKYVATPTITLSAAIFTTFGNRPAIPGPRMNKNMRVMAGKMYHLLQIIRPAIKHSGSRRKK